MELTYSAALLAHTGFICISKTTKKATKSSGFANWRTAEGRAVHGIQIQTQAIVSLYFFLDFFFYITSFIYLSLALRYSLPFLVQYVQATLVLIIHIHTMVASS